jgi:hypothetical protein
MFMTATIEIDDINPRTDEGRIYVEIYMTNRAFIQYRGDFTWVKITGTTLCLDWVNKTKSVKIDCSVLSAQDKVNIKAKVIEQGEETIIRAIRVVRYQRSIRH